MQHKQPSDNGLKTYHYLQKQAATFQTHTLAGVGFAMLFGTFAITTQGYDLASAGFTLSLVVAGICIAAIYTEYKQQKADRHGNKGTRRVHVLNSLAFLLAAGGCGLIATGLSANLFNTAALPGWMGPVPAGLFVGATLAFTIAACIRNKDKGFKGQLLAATPFILQMFGASFLMIGAFQSHGLSNILPTGGQSLHDLNISITSFSVIAAAAALATIFIGYKAFVKQDKQMLERVNGAQDIEPSTKKKTLLS